MPEHFPKFKGLQHRNKSYLKLNEKRGNERLKASFLTDRNWNDRLPHFTYASHAAIALL